MLSSHSSPTAEAVVRYSPGRFAFAEIAGDLRWRVAGLSHLVNVGPVQARDDERAAFAKEAENRRRLLASVALCASHLLPEIALAVLRACMTSWSPEAVGPLICEPFHSAKAFRCLWIRDRTRNR